jgi:hypothetical protein
MLNTKEGCLESGSMENNESIWDLLGVLLVICLN